MNGVAAMIGIFASAYIGTAIGLYSLCLEIPSLHKARKYVLYVPACTMLFVVYGIFSRNRDHRRTMIRFLRTPHKSIIMLGAIAKIIAEEKEKQPRRAPKKRVVFGGVISQFQMIFQGNRSLYY